MLNYDRFRLTDEDIKIGIETDLITKRKFIEIYIEYIKAFENRIKKIYVTVKSLLNDLKLMIDSGFYKIKGFNKKNSVDYKDGYRK